MPHVVRRRGLVTGVRIAVLLALAHGVNDALTAVLGALLPTLQTRFAAGTTTLALLVAAFNISTSVTQPALGALADRVGLRQVAAGGIALAAVAKLAEEVSRRHTVSPLVMTPAVARNWLPLHPMLYSPKSTEIGALPVRP